jgi:hypothetical protein
MKVQERKFEIVEERLCSECGKSFPYDLYWLRQYRVKLRESPINTEVFHSLCGDHKLAFYRPHLVQAFYSDRINDRDVEKMGFSIETLLEE